MRKNKLIFTALLLVSVCLSSCFNNPIHIGSGGLNFSIPDNPSRYHPSNNDKSEKTADESTNNSVTSSTNSSKDSMNSPKPSSTLSSHETDSMPSKDSSSRSDKTSTKPSESKSGKPSTKPSSDDSKKNSTSSGKVSHSSSSSKTDSTGDVKDDDGVLPSQVKYALTDFPESQKNKSFVDEYKTTDYYIDLATEFAISEIERKGYEAFRAYALLTKKDSNLESGDETVDKYVYGLAFTKNELIDPNQNLYSCGFIQITFDDGKGVKVNDFVLEYEDKANDYSSISEGVFVLGAEDQTKTYVIESSVILDGFSAIYYNKFFSYKQVSTFVMQISVKDNEKKNYDEDLDLYDFDAERYLYKASIFKNEENLGAFTLYGNDAAAAYQKAVSTMDALIRMQEENSIEITMNNIFIFDENLFHTFTTRKQRESVGGILMEQLNNIQLDKNQYLTVNKNGEVGIETDYTVLSSEQRTAKGLINTLISLSMAVGSFVVVVGGTALTGGVAGFILVGAEINVLAYSFSNLIEGVQDIYYGLKGDTTSEAINPVENAFQTVVKNDDLGEKLYHLWGWVSSLTTAFISPISCSINKAKYLGYGIVKTALQVARTTIVTAAKLVVTTACSSFVSSLASNITQNITGSELASKLVGYVSGLITGVYVYGKLHALDVKYDLSSLGGNYGGFGNIPKEEIEAERKKMGNERNITDNYSKKAGKLVDQTGDEQKSLLLERDYSSASKTKQEYYRDATIADINYSQNTKTVVKIIDEPAMSMSMAKTRNAILDSQDMNGYYDPNIDVLYINKKIADSDGTLTLKTIAHLMRHAYQMKYADFNSPILKSLRESNYHLDDSNNIAEKDAEAFAKYYYNRANDAFQFKVSNPNAKYVPNFRGDFSTPKEYYEELN